MNFVFFGTPRFAEIVLRKLIENGMRPAAVICNPDRPVGRKKTITPPPTKLLAQKNNINVLQPEKIGVTFMDAMRELQPDFFVVAAYAKILPQTLLDIPRLGTLGVHPSLLPKYRGASPIQSVILAGETQTGTTIYLIDEKMDHGPLLAAESLPLATGEAYLSLEEKLAALGGKLLAKVIPDFLAGKAKPQAQDESQATYTKKFTTDDGFVEPKDLDSAQRGDAEKATVILKKINALNPEPGAWTMQEGKRIKLLAAEITGDRLTLITTQREGEKPKTR